MRHYILLLICIIISANGIAQISTKEQPFSFKLDHMSILGEKMIETKQLPDLDMLAIEKEDMEDEKYGLPPRFGYSHMVNYNLENSGTWKKLQNGDKLWFLNIFCPHALSINLLYDRFWVPEGGKLFIYTSDKKHSIGAFTNRNNKGDQDHPQGFATGLLYGDKITLEYYQPNYVRDDAIISISSVVHGYRYINNGERLLGSSGSCQVNVNCSEGNNWQDEKRAVAMIIVDGNRECTGSLIKTTSVNDEPMFLTARHCVESYGSASSSPSLNNWIFYWNYESPGCSNINYEPDYYSTVGATILADYLGSDFALLQLTEDPINEFLPYYLGWDRTGNSGTGGVCIHHPKGDVKKISTYSMTPVSSAAYNESFDSSGNFWRVNWVSTLNGYGTTEKGSSGAPLLNSNHKVIGQLYGGSTDCSYLTGSDWFGKFSSSWVGNGHSYDRLSNWLDPIGSGVTTIDGSYPISISGPTFICNSSTSTYTIPGLISNYVVNWYFSNGFGPTSPIISSFGQTCTISNNLSYSYMGTINAAIYYNGILKKTLQKQVVAYGNFYGTYNYGNTTNQSFSPSSPVWVSRGVSAHLKSPNLIYKNISFSQTTPSWWQYLSNSGELYVTYPNGTSTAPIIINIQNDANMSTCDNSYQILVLPNDIMQSYKLNVFYKNDEQLEVSIVNKEEGNDFGSVGDYYNNTQIIASSNWSLEVYNATTGKNVFNSKVYGSTQKINTIGWEAGIYIVKATIADVTFTEKIIVNH